MEPVQTEDEKFWMIKKFIQWNKTFLELQLITEGATANMWQFIKLLKSVYNKSLCFKEQKCILNSSQRLKLNQNLYIFIFCSLNIFLFTFLEHPSMSLFEHYTTDAVFHWPMSINAKSRCHLGILKVNKLRHSYLNIM